MKLTFLGAAGTVTGSRFLVESGRSRILVDCGLFQGLKALRERNWKPFPVDPASIDAVVLTHAHVDHSGYLPALVRAGFRGVIWCTPGTAQLLSILLPDAGRLQEEDAEYRNRTRTTRHHPALPLFTEDDARKSLDRVRSHGFGSEFRVLDEVAASFTRAGHILGAACVRLRDHSTNIVFSGDVGRPDDPVMRPPQRLDPMDHLVLESTYGGRRHAEDDPKAALAEVVRRTVERGGKVLVPAFAVGRAQTLLHLLATLARENQIPRVPIFLNSPMAVDATRFYLDSEGELRLTPEQVDAAWRIARFVSSVEESKSLNEMTEPAVFLSASGMATGGRIVHHLKAYLPDPRSTVLLVGYQAAGTRGEALLRGADKVKIHGDDVPVRAEIRHLDSLSAHADEDELVEWLRPIGQAPRRTFLVHGEASGLDALRLRVQDDLRWDVEIATDSQTVELS